MEFVNQSLTFTDTLGSAAPTTATRGRQEDLPPSLPGRHRDRLKDRPKDRLKDRPRDRHPDPQIDQGLPLIAVSRNIADMQWQVFVKKTNIYICVQIRVSSNDF